MIMQHLESRYSVLKDEVNRIEQASYLYHERCEEFPNLCELLQQECCLKFNLPTPQSQLQIVRPTKAGKKGRRHQYTDRSGKDALGFNLPKYFDVKIYGKAETLTAQEIESRFLAPIDSLQSWIRRHYPYEGDRTLKAVQDWIDMKQGKEYHIARYNPNSGKTTH